MDTVVSQSAPVGKFGALKRVDLRSLWPKEAGDFTPWLRENLDVLSDAVGMDLEFRVQEAPVGPFSLDLLVHDLGTDRIVIIENQIEQTDHDHLGKLLTYAAGHDSAVAIWIAASFREEHRQALDWLNQRTDSNTEFFGVVVEALQIDNSRPACHFRLVSFPNDWQKSTRPASKGTTTAKTEAYREFFQQLIDRLREKHHFTKATKGQPQGWYSFGSGKTGISYSIAFSTGSIRAELYIDRGDAAWNKATFDYLHTGRDEIDQKFGESLKWDRLDGKQACRIDISRSADFTDPGFDTEDVLQWSIDHLLKFQAVFGPLLNAMPKDHPPHE